MGLQHDDLRVRGQGAGIERSHENRRGQAVRRGYAVERPRPEGSPQAGLLQPLDDVFPFQPAQISTVKRVEQLPFGAGFMQADHHRLDYAAGTAMYRCDAACSG